MLQASEIKQTIKAYILEEFLPGENPDELTDSTELMTLGILDSIATLKLVTFLEPRFGITLQAHELGKEHMNTLDSIASLVLGKLA